MSIKKYEVLLQTADLGSFTKASEVLGYTQSAISHIVTGLEDELGLKLLTRDRFGVRLTPEGEALLPAIRAVCQQNQEVTRQAAQFHGLEIGQVRIGTFLSVSVHILPDLLHTFPSGIPTLRLSFFRAVTRILSDGSARAASTLVFSVCQPTVTLNVPFCWRNVSWQFSPRTRPRKKIPSLWKH